MKLNDILKRHGVGVGSSKEIPDDLTSSPGPKMLIAGDMEHGFFGEVTSEELISSSEMWAKVGRVPYRIDNEDMVWLKFAYKGKIIFKSFKSNGWAPQKNQTRYFKQGISFTHNGHKYLCRNLKGGELVNGRISNENVRESEWNTLMLSLFNSNEIKKHLTNAEYNNYVSSSQTYFNLGYTLEEMGLTGTNKRVTLTEYRFGERQNDMYQYRDVVARPGISMNEDWNIGPYNSWNDIVGRGMYIYHLALEYVEEA